MGAIPSYPERRVGPEGYIHGWIKVGAPGAPVSASSAQQYIARVSGKLSPRELGNYDVAEYKRTRLEPLYHFSPEQMKAIGAYTETKYQEINEAARAGRDPGPEARTITSAMRPLPDDLILLRELNGADAMHDFKVGDVITDPAFASATLAPRGRFASGRAGTTVMHILTPKGTPAVYADPASGYPEDEMILDRGTSMVIMRVAPRQGHEGFVTDVYLLALPREPHR
jgi:hypothetical protein